MTWGHLGQHWRCDGRDALLRKRCTVQLTVGALVWVDGKRAYCPDCATSSHIFAETTEAELAERVRLRPPR